MLNEDYVRRVRDRLAGGELLDVTFDRLLPWDVRSNSMQHWTPLCVARKAAQRFREHRVRRVLDVGSGPGKFCVAAAAAQPELWLCGVEQRPRLLAAAEALADLVHVRNVEFRSGDALVLPWSDFDGLYFFNPFGENLAVLDDAFDSTVPLSAARFRDELLGVASLLGSTRVGTVVITYHGLGGPIPSSYDLVCEDLVGTATLRTWVKTRLYEADWYHLDRVDDVPRVPRAELGRTFAAGGAFE